MKKMWLFIRLVGSWAWAWFKIVLLMAVSAAIATLIAMMAFVTISIVFELQFNYKTAAIVTLISAFVVITGVTMIMLARDKRKP